MIIKILFALILTTLISCNGNKKANTTKIIEPKKAEKQANRSKQESLKESEQNYILNLDSLLYRENTVFTSGIATDITHKKYDFDSGTKELGSYSLGCINNLHQPHIYARIIVSFNKTNKWYETDTSQEIIGLQVFNKEFVLWGAFHVGMDEKSLIHLIENKIPYKKGIFWVVQMGEYLCSFKILNHQVEEIELIKTNANAR